MPLLYTILLRLVFIVGRLRQYLLAMLPEGLETDHYVCFMAWWLAVGESSSALAPLCVAIEVGVIDRSAALLSAGLVRPLPVKAPWWEGEAG